MGDDAEREKKRKRQEKRMTKIVNKAWGLDRSEPFQDASAFSFVSYDGSPLDLRTMGLSLGKGTYQIGRKGWEKFASDIGGIYQRFIVRWVSHVLCVET